MFEIASSTATNVEQFINSNRLMQCWQALSSYYSPDVTVHVRHGKCEVALPEECVLNLVEP